MTTRTGPKIIATGVTDSREVSVTLTGHDPVVLAPTHGGRACRFRPDRLDLRWTNGTLYRAQLSGQRLKDDGTPYARLEREGVSYIDESDRGYVDPADGRWVHVLRSGLAPDAPDWVRELVEKHTPTA